MWTIGENDNLIIAAVKLFTDDEGRKPQDRNAQHMQNFYKNKPLLGIAA